MAESSNLSGPTRYSIGVDHVETSPLVSLLQVKGHLAILRAISCLKEEVGRVGFEMKEGGKEKEKEKKGEKKGEKEKEGRWGWFVSLAVERCLSLRSIRDAR